MTEATTEALPVRYCHGCKQYDDHPRVTVSIDMHRADLDNLYHFDCLPTEHHDDVIAPIIAEATVGTHGDDLREIATAHAASIPEAPADKPAKRRGAE